MFSRRKQKSKESVDSFQIFLRKEQGEKLFDLSDEGMVLNYTKIDLNITKNFPTEGFF